MVGNDQNKSPVHIPETVAVIGSGLAGSMAAIFLAKSGFGGAVYIMPCGGTEEMYSLNNRSVAELAMKKGWRYSDRLQIPLFKNAWGT